MRRLRSVTTLVCATAMLLLTAPVASAEPRSVSHPAACPYSDVGSPATKTDGYRGTSVTSYQVAGPGTIHYTVTKSAAQTFGASASVGFDVSAFIASAHVQFGVSYAYTATSTQAWGYDTTIPSGRTGLMAVLHRDDRVSYTETIHHENCTTTSDTGYTYLPLSSTSNSSYCIIRDLAPYGYSSWRSSCAGE